MAGSVLEKAMSQKVKRYMVHCLRMKKLGLVFICCLQFIHFPLQSQNVGWDQVFIQFNDTIGSDAYKLDSVTGKVNIWHQAVPMKSILGPPALKDSAMITIADSAYPPNVQSTFTVPLIVNCKPCIHLLLIGRYWVETDTLNDFGTIQFSPDNGQQWIDLIDDTTIVPISMWTYNSPNPFRPTLSGSSGGWTYFEGDFVDLLSQYDVEVGDTILYRFGFSSDSHHTGHDGLAYEYLRFDQQYVFTSILENEVDQINIYPNPVNDLVTIENPVSNQTMVIELFDSHGNNILRGKLDTGRNKFDLSSYPSGAYIYRVFSITDSQQKTGKIIISH